MWPNREGSESEVQTYQNFQLFTRLPAQGSRIILQAACYGIGQLWSTVDGCFGGVNAWMAPCSVLLLTASASLRDSDMRLTLKFGHAQHFLISDSSLAAMIRRKMRSIAIQIGANVSKLRSRGCAFHIRGSSPPPVCACCMRLVRERMHVMRYVRIQLHTIPISTIICALT